MCTVIVFFKYLYKSSVLKNVIPYLKGYREEVITSYPRTTKLLIDL